MIQTLPWDIYYEFIFRNIHAQYILPSILALLVATLDRSDQEIKPTGRLELLLLRMTVILESCKSESAVASQS